MTSMVHSNVIVAAQGFLNPLGPTREPSRYRCETDILAYEQSAGHDVDVVKRGGSLNLVTIRAQRSKTCIRGGGSAELWGGLGRLEQLKIRFTAVLCGLSKIEARTRSVNR